LIRCAVLALAALLLFSVAACGDDDDGRVEDPTSVSSTIGPAASLPRGVKAVTPVHAAQASADAIGPVCVTLDLLAGEGIVDGTALLVLNQENVTDSLEWTTTDDNPPSEATGCYTPPEPLAPAVYAATLTYADTTDRTFIYNWQFEVTG
jgi:hypothetical protein